MKNSPVLPILVGVLFVCGAMTAAFSFWYFISIKELQRLQAQYVGINNNRNAVQSLAAEAVEYSKRNPAIDPILFEFDVKSRTAAPTPTTPKTGIK